MRLWVLAVLAVLSAGCVEDPFRNEDEYQYEAAPSIRFHVDEAEDRLVVQAVSGEADWRGFDLKSSRAVWFRLNGKPAEPVPVGQWRTVGAGMALAGDMLEFCARPPQASKVDLAHTPTNTLVFTASFEDVAARPWCA